MHSSHENTVCGLKLFSAEETIESAPKPPQRSFETLHACQAVRYLNKHLDLSIMFKSKIKHNIMHALYNELKSATSNSRSMKVIIKMPSIAKSVIDNLSMLLRKSFGAVVVRGWVLGKFHCRASYKFG